MKRLFNNFLKILSLWIKNPLVRQYFSGSFWMMAARGVWILSSFTVGIYVARKLGPADYGLVNYAIAFVGLFSFLASSGIGPLIVRDLLKMPGKRGRILGNLFCFQLILLLLMSIVLVCALLLKECTGQLRLMCLIIGAGYYANLSFPCNCLLNAEVHNGYHSASQIAACLFHSLIRFCAVFFSLDLVWFAIAEFSSMMSNAAVTVFGYFREYGRGIRWSFRWGESLALFRPAFLLGLCSLLFLIYSRTDTLMIEYFSGYQAVGYYTIASRFTENWQICGNLLVTVFFPAVVGASGISRGIYEKQLHRLYFLVVWTMFAAAGITILLGKPVILLLYGNVYLPSVSALHVLALTLPVMLLLNVFSAWAVNENRLLLNASVLAAGALLNVLLNGVLIPRFSFVGAAWSSLLAMPLGILLILPLTEAGRGHLCLILRSVFTLPSFRLD